ncbi:hypothetical protein CC80DRAFT_506141 [Byssothecium circinans]|uniref:Uncharacterized protein n=1 Tax=Byssothecium circinans TaxID=147558 RepID=A0A6A5U136_9PLEO|nr:hypothetical protein CC80DRAFT_506141 [Byssothecium circinans]
MIGPPKVAGLGDMRNRIAAVIAEANAQGANPVDVIPDEAQVYFQNLAQLAEAKEYIKECEAREVELREKIAETEQKLKEAQQAVEDMPEDHVQRLQDLRVAHTSVEFYRHMHSDAEERASCFQRKWKALLDKQHGHEAVQFRVDALQEESDHQKSVIANLASANRSMQDTIETVQATHEHAMAEKAKQIQSMKDAHQTEAMYHQEQANKYEAAEHDRDMVDDTVNSLVDALEMQTAGVASTLNAISARRRHMDKLNMVIVSELASLRRTFSRCTEILGQYKPVIDELLKATPANAVRLLDDHRVGLNASYNELEGLDGLRQAMADEPIDPVRNELGDLGTAAKAMHRTLESMAQAFAASTAVDSSQPNGVWRSLCSRLRNGSPSK